MSQNFWLIGASEGIGAAVAKRLSQKGHRVAISARSEQKLQSVLSACSGSEHLALPLDVSNLATIVAAHERLSDGWGGVDTLVYYAGNYEPMGAMELSIAPIEAMIDTNLTGAFRTLAVVLPKMISANAGRIVLIGSVAGYRGLGNAMGYGASKAGINHLAENLRVDLSSTNIRVQLVCPGFVRTRLTDKNDFEMPSLVSPEHAAEKIVKGLETSKFEIHFPKKLTLFLKFLSVLPSSLYFPILSLLLRQKK